MTGVKSLEIVTDVAMIVLRKKGVTVDKRLCSRARALEEVQIGCEVRDSQVRKPALPGAEEITGPANLQVDL